MWEQRAHGAVAIALALDVGLKETRHAFDESRRLKDKVLRGNRVCRTFGHAILQQRASHKL